MGWVQPKKADTDTRSFVERRNDARKQASKEPPAHASAAKATDKAYAASDAAKAPQDHAQAASLHTAAASAHGAVGRTVQAEQHRQAAQEHAAKAISTKSGDSGASGERNRDDHGRFA